MGLLSLRAQRMRMQRVLPWVRGRILDIGCGTGAILDRLDGPTCYHGVEGDAALVADLRRRYPQHTFERADLDVDVVAAGRVFDTVLMLAVIEHVYNQRHLFEQVLERLAAGGRIVITTPTPLGDRVHRLGARLGLFARSAEDHHPIIFNRARFRVFARRFGLRIEYYRRFAFGCNQIVVLSRAGDGDSEGAVSSATRSAGTIGPHDPAV